MLPDVPCQKYVIQTKAARHNSKENLMTEQKKMTYFYRRVVELFYTPLPVYFLLPNENNAANTMDRPVLDR